MGLNNIIKYISIGLTIALISSTSSAGSRTVFITTDKAEIAKTVKETVNSRQRKINYLSEIKKCNPQNEYQFKANKNTPNEIGFIQTDASLTIFQLIGDELETVINNGSKSSREISKLLFKRLDDNNIIIDVERISYENPEKPNRLHYQVNASFTQGNWEDLMNNRPVTISVSRQEEIKSKPYILDWMKRKVFNKAIEKAGSLIKGVFATTGLEFKAPTIKGNLDQMIHTIDKTEIEFEVQWGLF